MTDLWYYGRRLASRILRSHAKSSESLPTKNTVGRSKESFSSMGAGSNEDRLSKKNESKITIPDPWL